MAEEHYIDPNKMSGSPYAGGPPSGLPPLPETTMQRLERITPRPFSPVGIPRKIPKPYHMDQFFGKVAGCLGDSTPDVTDIEFTSGYVVCYRHGLFVAIMTAEVVFNTSDPPEAYRLSISKSYDPDYPEVDGITETYVDAADTFKTETGSTGEELFVSLALNWARDLTP